MGSFIKTVIWIVAARLAAGMIVDTIESAKKKPTR